MINHIPNSLLWPITTIYLSIYLSFPRVFHITLYAHTQTQNAAQCIPPYLTSYSANNTEFLAFTPTRAGPNPFLTSSSCSNPLCCFPFLTLLFPCV